jgi:hypothetical protein
MDTITPLQFWSGILVVTIPQVFKLLSDWRNARAAEKQAKEQAEAEKVKNEATVSQTQTEGWERLVKTYQSQIESMQRLQDENAELRKLPLKLAVMEQDMKQCGEDKEDWKRYAIKLADQLKELGQVPIPFRRTPADGNTQEKIPAITTQQIEAAQKQNEENTIRGGS